MHYITRPVAAQRPGRAVTHSYLSFSARPAALYNLL